MRDVTGVRDANSCRQNLLGDANARRVSDIQVDSGQTIHCFSSGLLFTCFHASCTKEKTLFPRTNVFWYYIFYFYLIFSFLPLCLFSLLFPCHIFCIFGLFGPFFYLFLSFYFNFFPLLLSFSALFYFLCIVFFFIFPSFIFLFLFPSLLLLSCPASPGTLNAPPSDKI